MVGMAGDGQPLGELLKQRMLVDEIGLPLPGVWDRLTTTLVEGTALGWNPVKTARLMRDGLAGGLQKALVIARTEQLRVYRESTRATYDESGIVTGHKRVCAHDMRVCPACLADDGTIYPVDVAIPDHPNGRCTSVPVLRGEEAPTWTAGEDWLKLQNEDTQRSILGGHYDGWNAGDFRLADTLRRTEHKVWGPGLAVKPLKDLKELLPNMKAASSFRDQVGGLGVDDVLPVGDVSTDIVRKWTDDVEGNAEVVLTGKQRAHYLEQHPEMARYEDLIETVVLAPDEIHRNKNDRDMAIFYRRLNDEFYLRAAILIEPTPGVIKHSILSFRLARKREVENGRKRLVWQR
jgi:SPP1 gp7 family putative phage head morphogenesis protein